jgi:hypothetical protein
LVISVDDWLPFTGSNLAFSGVSDDGGLWGPFIEKAFAKANGNYENIQAGDPAEALEFLVGAPSMRYVIADAGSINNDPAIAWNIISDGD